MKVNTIHSKNEHGRQVTERVVKQGAVEYRFRVTDAGHEYQGDGDPPDAALDALARFKEADEGTAEDGEAA